MSNWLRPVARRPAERVSWHVSDLFTTHLGYTTLQLLLYTRLFKVGSLDCKQHQALAEAVPEVQKLLCYELLQLREQRQRGFHSQQRHKDRAAQSYPTGMFSRS